eukprot:1151750-Pelagomonas_calceolata.AAC.15
MMARLKAIQVNVRSAWGIGQLLFQDMLSLAKHLFKMGWDVKQLDKGKCEPFAQAPRHHPSKGCRGWHGCGAGKSKLPPAAPLFSPYRSRPGLCKESAANTFIATTHTTGAHIPCAW